MTKQLTWLITGCASGFGQEFVLQLLARGDNVIATSRFLSEVEAFQEKGASIMELDVTWTQSMLNAKAEETIAIHSFIDVLVNNAGYGLLGTMEDLTHEQLLEQLNTNTFGAINVTRAFLPHYRERKAGTVVFMGSLNGTEGEGMSDAYYFNPTNPGLSESLRKEIAPIGIKTLYVEPGGFRTSFLAPGHIHLAASKFPEYESMSKDILNFLKEADGNQPGDPAKAVKVIIDVIRGEGIAMGRAFPEHLLLGRDAVEVVTKRLETMLWMVQEWEDVSCSTDF